MWYFPDLSFICLFNPCDDAFWSHRHFNPYCGDNLSYDSREPLYGRRPKKCPFSTSWCRFDVRSNPHPEIIENRISSGISPYNAWAQPDRSLCFVHGDHRGIYWNWRFGALYNESTVWSKRMSKRIDSRPLRRLYRFSSGQSHSNLGRKEETIIRC